MSILKRRYRSSYSAKYDLHTCMTAPLNQHSNIFCTKFLFCFVRFIDQLVGKDAKVSLSDDTKLNHGYSKASRSSVFFIRMGEWQFDIFCYRTERSNTFYLVFPTSIPKRVDF